MRSCISLLALMAPALAAGNPAASPIDTIVVTAHRTPVPAAGTGSAYTVLTREDLERQQVNVASDALRMVPGIAVSRAGPPGAQTQIRLRGAEANHVLVVIDGVEVNDLAADDAYAFEHLTAFDLERIEVVRGPQSALWGSDALAGVVNVATRRPTGALESGGFAEGGAWDLFNAGARIGSAGAWGHVAAGFSRLQSDGENAANAGDEADGYDNDTLSLLGTLDTGGPVVLDAHWRHSDARNEYDASGPVDGEYVAVDADNVKDVRQDFARAGATLALLEDRLRQSLHYSVARTETDSSAEESFPDGDDADGGRDRSAISGTRYGLQYQASMDLGRDRARPRGTLTFAMDHERESFVQRAEVSFGDPNQDQSLRNTGYVLEAIAWPTEAIALSASVRHDDNSDFGDVNTWRTTLSWRLPATGTRFHGSFGTGQKSPTMFERFGYTPDQFLGNPDLEPETSHGWDAGVEQSLLDGRLVLDATWFDADLRNEIDGFVYVPELFTFTAANRSGRSTREGLETGVRATLSERWTLAASYTLTNARQDDGTGADPREVRRPRHQAALDLAGRWLDGRLQAHLGGTYAGRREDDVFLVDPPYARRTTLDAYTLLKVAVSYDLTESVTLYGRVENLLDEDYEEVYGYNTPGRGAFLGARVNFAPGARP